MCLVRTITAVLLVSFLLLAPAPPLPAFNMGYHYEMIREVGIKQGLSRDAWCVMLGGNSYIDLFQRSETEYIVDDDFCRVAAKIVECAHFDNMYDQQTTDRCWRILIKNTHDAVERAVQQNNAYAVLLVAGISLHIVEDFYAHTNWAELDMSRFVQKRDATYFDVVNNPLAALVVMGGAIEVDRGLPFRRYEHDEGLFSHGIYGSVACPVSNQVLTSELIYKVAHPVHAVLNKDYNGRPYFEWALRCSYKASLQWLMLIEKWVRQDMNRPDLWDSLRTFTYPGNKDNLYRLTSFDEGTIRWIFTYGGAWKCGRRWSDTDVIMDDLPNVPGIGVTEQTSPDYPPMGIEWFENCFHVVKGLFESRHVDPSTGMHIVRRLSTRIDNLAQAKQDPNDFGEIVKVYLEEVPLTSVPNLSDAECPLVKNAISYMATCLGNSWNDVKWLRIQIPKVEDMDTGGGAANVNNEEVGGTSDFWPMIFINNLEYSEAEYVDQSAPNTVWGVIKPLWTVDTLRFHIKLYESDPWNHKVIKMKIAPEAQGGNPSFKCDLQFTFDPAGGGSILGLPSQCEWYTTPNGFFVKSQGTDSDWGARVFVHIGLMTDKRVEFVVCTDRQNDSDTNDTAWADVGPYMWLMDHPDYDDFRRLRLKSGVEVRTAVDENGVRHWCEQTYSWAGHTDCYAFDPGPGWTKNKIYRLAVHKNNDHNDPWKLSRFHGRSLDVVKGANEGATGVWLNASTPTWTAARNPNLPRVASAITYWASLSPTAAAKPAVKAAKPVVRVANPDIEFATTPFQPSALHEPDVGERPVISAGPKLSTAQHTIPIERLPGPGGDAPLFSTRDSLRHNSWYFAVATRTATLSQSQTDDRVYLAFLDQNKSVLGRYLLDSFARRDFRRGNTDFFWLELQYNRPGVGFSEPHFDYRRIKYIKLEKPGEDDWCLAHIEVWVNDLLLYEGAPNLWVNDANQSREIRIR